jgi:hypothetical protein
VQTTVLIDLRQVDSKPRCFENKSRERTSQLTCTGAGCLTKLTGFPHLGDSSSRHSWAVSYGSSETLTLVITDSVPYASGCKLCLLNLDSSSVAEIDKLNFHVCTMSALRNKTDTVFLSISMLIDCRSQWPRGLRRRSTTAWLLGSQVPIPLGTWMFVSCVYIVISSQVLFHDGSLLHSKFNTQHLITVHSSSRILTHVRQIHELQRILLLSSSFSTGSLIQITSTTSSSMTHVLPLQALPHN